MKKTAILLSCVIGALASCSSPAEKTETTAPADTVAAAPTPTPPPPVDSATAMKNWMDYMTPGEMHKMLASQTGKWSSDMTMWMAEGAPPTTSKGEADFKMIMGGRYQQSTFKGDVGGMPFEGIGVTGYDNSKKMFVSTWVDNMGTGIMELEGTYDAGSKSIEMKGKCMDPMTNAEKNIREVLKMVDDKNIVMEMYESSAGVPEHKTMEIKYAKK